MPPIDVSAVSEDRRRHLPRIALARHDMIIAEARRNPAVFMAHVLRDEQSGKRVQLAPMHLEWQDLITRHDRLILWSFVEAGKTSAISIGRALYEVGRDSNIRIAVISKTKALAQKIVRSCQQMMTSESASAIAYREVFPHVRPARDPGLPWTTMALTIERQAGGADPKDPTIQASGAFGNIVGSRIDLLIIDDVLDSVSTRTPAPRDALWDWFHGTVVGRLTANARVVAVGNAYHPEDIMHRLERSGRYKAFRFPVVDPRTKLPAWPERWSAERIENAKVEFGPLDYARQLFCQPRDDDSARFKREWVEQALEAGRGLKMLPTRDAWLAELALAPYAATLRVVGVNPSALRIFVGVDLAVQLHSAADLTAFVVIGVLPDGTRRLLWIDAGHYGAPEILAKIADLEERYGAIFVVENNAAQDYIVQLVRDRTAIPVVPFTTGKQKAHPEFGVEGIAAELVAGKWILPCASPQKMEPHLFALVQDMLSYDPRSHVGDRFMAMWFAREGARGGKVGATGAKVGVRAFGQEDAPPPKLGAGEIVERVLAKLAKERGPTRLVYVEPHSREAGSIEATEATFAALPQGGRFRRDPDGAFVWRGDMLLLDCVDPSFVVWASAQQGYARRAVAAPY